MPKGGYKIVSLGNIDLTSAGVTIPGIYEKIESANGKPILLTGISLAGIEKPAIFATLYSTGATYGVTMSNFSNGYNTITIDSSDTVKYTFTGYQSQAAGDPTVSGEDGPSASM